MLNFFFIIKIKRKLSCFFYNVWIKTFDFIDILSKTNLIMMGGGGDLSMIIIYNIFEKAWQSCSGQFSPFPSW